MASPSVPIESALRAGLAFGCSGGFALGEFWSAEQPISDASTYELKAFVSADRAMVVQVPDRNSGAVITRTVDFRLAQEFSPQHELSVMLVKQAATSGKSVFVYDQTDEVLSRLPIQTPATAIAVPVLDGNALYGVIVYYSSTHEEVRSQARHVRQFKSGHCWRRDKL